MSEPTEQADGSLKDRFKRFVAALDRMPPIRLPIGPPIPWRYGLPLFVALVVIYLLFAVTSGPRSEPLFTGTPSTAAPSEAPGVREPPATTIDFVDLTMKLLLVLVLAYGSLWLLKRFGFGGATPSGGANPNALHVISHLSLAPNRSVHVIRAPDGRALVIGSTPTQVNLIADLGPLREGAGPQPGDPTFFDLLNTKIK